MPAPKYRSPDAAVRTRARPRRSSGIAATLAELRQATLIDADDAETDAWLADAGYDVRGELAGGHGAPSLAPSLMTALPSLARAPGAAPTGDARWYDPFAACEVAAEHLAGYYRRTLEAVKLIDTTLGVYAASSGVDWQRADVLSDLRHLQARTREVRQRLGTWQKKIDRAVAKAEKLAAAACAAVHVADMEVGSDADTSGATGAPSERGANGASGERD